MAKNKMSRHELKDDAFFDFLTNSKDYYDTHKNIVHYTIIGILVLITGYFLITNQMQSRKQAALQALNTLENTYYSQQFDQAITLGQDFLQKYQDTKFAQFGYIILGNAFYQTGKYDQAELKYDDYLQKFGYEELYSGAALEGIANCFMQQQKFTDAAEALIKNVGKLNDSYVVPFILEKAALAYKNANNNAKAAEVYKQIIDEHPEYPQITLVEMYYSEIKQSL